MPTRSFANLPPDKPSHRLRPFVLAFCISWCIAFAQNPGVDVHIAPRVQDKKGEQQSDREGLLMKSRVELVLVPVTVTDPMNRLVTGLDKENFEIYEGKKRQEIRHFSSEDVPISVGVIFDMSGSMGTKIERAREAVIKFCQTANPQDEFFLITFSERPQDVSGFTRSVDELGNRLLFTAAKGRTALLDAIYLGISKMREAGYAKKSLLIISDGGDNHSRYTEGEIKSLVEEGLNLPDRSTARR